MFFMNKLLYRFFRFFPALRRIIYAIWNRYYFQLLGIKFGCNLLIDSKIYVSGGGKIRIGDNFHFSSGEGVNPVCRNIRGCLHVESSHSFIEIGDNVGISSACLWAKKSIIIGNNVNIGGDSIIIDTDSHPHNYLHRRNEYKKILGKEYTNIIPSEPIEIGDDVWIGARCIILKGVHIGARSIIAAGSVVVKDVPSDVVAGGNPCKVIRRMNYAE